MGEGSRFLTMTFLLSLLLLTVVYASQLFGFLNNDLDVSSTVSGMAAVFPSLGVVQAPTTVLRFEDTVTQNTCASFNADTFSCITGFLDLNLTTWSAQGVVMSHKPLVNTFPLFSGYGAGASAASFGSHVYAVATVPVTIGTLTTDRVMLFADGISVFNTTVPKDKGLVDFLSAGPSHVWFGFSNVSVETHWDTTGAYDIVGYPATGKGAVFSVNLTGVATWSNCNWDGTKQLLCLSKLDQANGPTSLFAIDDATGAMTTVCPAIHGLPDAFFPTATAYDTSVAAWYAWGFVQHVQPVVSAFYKLDASCSATQIKLQLPAGYTNIDSLFVLNQ